MKPTLIEDDVRRMLSRRAADVPDDLGTFGSDNEPNLRHEPASNVDRDADRPVTYTEVALPHQRRVRPPWLIAAAAFLVAVPMIAAAIAQWTGDDELQVEVVPEVIDSPTVASPAAALTLVVNLQQSLPLTPATGVTLTILGADGAQVGEPHLVASPKVFDEGAEPGSVGNDLVAIFDDIQLPEGEYRLRVRADGCTSGCADVAPHPEISCEGDVQVIAPAFTTYLRVKSDASLGFVCEGPGPFTQERAEAASALLDRQIASGWVPYNGDEVIDGFPTPDDSWVPATFGGQPGCERPGALGADVQFICVFDAPAGNVVGYHISNLGFVPADLIGAIDVDGKFVERFGCNPQEDHACIQRWLADQDRQELERPDLSDEERAKIEAEIEELEADIERSGGAG